MTDIIDYQRLRPGEQPPYLHPGYGSTVKRAPKHQPVRIDHTLSEVTGPTFSSGWAGPDNADLTRQHKGAPIGSRMIVARPRLNEQGLAGAPPLGGLWQANAPGRYVPHARQHDPPPRPHFNRPGPNIHHHQGQV